jgi:hypothetical protein
VVAVAVIGLSTSSPEFVVSGLAAAHGDTGLTVANLVGSRWPHLATVSPSFVDGWLGMFNGDASKVSLGVLPTLWTLTGPLCILGGLLFGIATFRSRICRVGLAYCWLRGPRWPRGRAASPWVAAKNSDTDGAGSGLVGECALV